MSSYERHSNQILRGTAARWLLWPATTGVPAVGVALTSGAGAWGAAADIVAAGGIATQYFIGAVCLDTAGAAQIFEIQLGAATPATDTCVELRINPTAVTVNNGIEPLPYPVAKGAGAQTSGRAGGAAAKVIGVSILYTVFL